MLLPRIFSSLAAIVLVFWVLLAAKHIILPLVVAVFFWYIINAMADLWGKLIPKPLFLKYFLALASLIFFFWVPIQLANDSIYLIIDDLPHYQENYEILASRIKEQFGISRELPSLGELLAFFELKNYLSDIAAGLASISGNIILILVYVVFLLFEQRSFRRKLQNFAKSRTSYERINTTITEIAEKVNLYLWVKIIVSLLTGIICYSIFAVFKVDFAIFWAVTVFFLNFIPNIGPIFAVICPSVLASLQFASFTSGLTLAIITGVVQAAIGNFLEPKLMGKSLNLSPMVLMISLVVWGSMWGIIGAFLSVPIMVTLMVILAKFSETKGFAILLSADGDLD